MGRQLEETNEIQNSNDFPQAREVGKSYTHKTSSRPILFETVGNVVDIAAEKDPDRVAIIIPFQGIKKTYAQFKKDVDQVAMGFVSIGLKKGDKIIIYSPNCYEWSLIQFAAAKVGIILALMNPSYRKVEVDYLMKLVDCKALICPESFHGFSYYNLLNELEPNIKLCEPGQIQSSVYKGLQHVIIIGDSNLPGTWSFKDVVSHAEKEDLLVLREMEKRVDPDDVANLIFTSGTTGFPKAASLSHYNVVNSGYFTALNLHYDKEKHIICVPLPLFHIFGCIIGNLCNWLCNCTIVYPSAKFDIVKILDCIANYRCSMIYGTPTMILDFFQAHANNPKFDVSSLRAAVSGGAPVPPKLIEMWCTILNLPLDSIQCVYGSTEVGPVTLTQGPVAYFNQYPLSDIIDHYEVKVIDKDGNRVDKGQLGEVCIKGPCVFHEYFQQPDKTNEAVSKTRWFYTGDLGILDEKDRVAIAGRIKDVIIKGGENISPTEVESYLRAHPSVQEIAIIGVPDVRYGEDIWAYVKLKTGYQLAEKEFCDFFKGKISGFKIPVKVFFLEDFPMTTSGKIQKFKLRERALKFLNQE